MYRLRSSLASEFVGLGVCAPRSLSASEASEFVGFININVYVLVYSRCCIYIVYVVLRVCVFNVGVFGFMLCCVCVSFLV